MPLSALSDLERLKDRFDAAATRRKLMRLRQLARASLARADELRRLHEVLCFLRAYPDNAVVLAAVSAMLQRFEHRADARRHRDELAYSGIAGTTLWFPFFYPTAHWLAVRWPRQLRLDRSDTAAGESIAHFLPVLLTSIEAHGVREARKGGFEALDRVRGRDSDATFLLRRVTALGADERLREAVYDAINPSCELLPAGDTPSRTRSVWRSARPAWQAAPLRRERPDLALEIARAPRAVRRAGRGEARELLDLARGTMVTRQRDLDAFAYGNARDVWIVEDQGGLAFAFNGMVAARRSVIAAGYGGLTLQNGVPIGYHQWDLTGRATAVSFNTFETFRGGEAAFTFARALAALHHLFGSTSFSVEPYQLGLANDEGLASGAWWFYAKLGFRPRSNDGARLAQREFARVRRTPAHRSDIDTLRALARHHLFFDLDATRPAPLITPASVGFAAARHLTALAGSDRRHGLALAGARVLDRFGLTAPPRMNAAERHAWTAWVPLLSMLPLHRWSIAERSALLALVRAKAAPSERGYVRKLAALPRLERELAAISVRNSG